MDHKRVSYKLLKRVRYTKQRGFCAGCELELPYNLFTVDHVTSRAKKGSDAEENLQLLCGHCNSVKDDRSMECLRLRLAELEEAEAQKVLEEEA